MRSVVIAGNIGLLANGINTELDLGCEMLCYRDVVCVYLFFVLDGRLPSETRFEDGVVVWTSVGFIGSF